MPWTDCSRFLQSQRNRQCKGAKRLRPDEEANRRNGPQHLFPTPCTFRKSIDEDNHVVEAELFRVQVGGEARAAADIEEMMWMRVEEARGLALGIRWCRWF